MKWKTQCVCCSWKIGGERQSIGSLHLPSIAEAAKTKGIQKSAASSSARAGIRSKQRAVPAARRVIRQEIARCKPAEHGDIFLGLCQGCYEWDWPEDANVVDVQDLVSATSSSVSPAETECAVPAVLVPFSSAASGSSYGTVFESSEERTSVAELFGSDVWPYNRAEAPDADVLYASRESMKSSEDKQPEFDRLAMSRREEGDEGDWTFERNLEKLYVFDDTKISEGVGLGALKDESHLPGMETERI